MTTETEYRALLTRTMLVISMLKPDSCEDRDTARALWHDVKAVLDRAPETAPGSGWYEPYCYVDPVHLAALNTDASAGAVLHKRASGYADRPLYLRPPSPTTALEFPASWAQMIHYPECWDTAAYPDLSDAIHEALAWSGCSVCKPATAPEQIPPEAACSCSHDLHLDAYSGGAAPEGVYGALWVVVEGVRKKYVLADQSSEPKVMPVPATAPVTALATRLDQLRAYAQFEKDNRPHPGGVPHITEWAVAEIERLTAEGGSDRYAAQAQGTHPAPCARACEAQAFKIEIRKLRRLLAARVAIPNAYYDDGEAQGHQHGISFDFIRDPVDDLDAKLSALNVARSYDRPASNPAPSDTTNTLYPPR